MTKTRMKNQSFHKILALIGTIFLLMVISFQPVDALTEFYIEDFTSTTYMDMDETSATGWGSGEISSPKMNPVIVGTCDTPDFALEVFLQDNYAYVADMDGHMKVIDISNKSNPQIIGGFGSANIAMDVFVVGDYAYVIDTVGGGSYDYVRVANLTVPTNPVHVPFGYYDHLATMFGLCVSGNYIYVANGLYGLNILNATEPTHMHQLGICDTPGEAREVEVVGNYAYVVDDSRGLQVINVTDPTDPTIVGNCETSDSAHCLTVSGNYAYVADFRSGVQVINITDPTDPTLVSTIDTPDASFDVAISGDFAYIADRYSGIQVVNISDPTNPEIVGECDTPSLAESIVISGEYAYVADGSSGLQIIQIADISPLSLVGDCSTSGDAIIVSVDGDFAYIGGENFAVVNVSNPSDPTIVGTYATPSGYAFDLCVEGDLAYLTDGNNGGLHIIDISDPTNPASRGFWDAANGVYGIDVEGDYAYAATTSEGLQVVNITDPTTPASVGEYIFPDSMSLGVSVIGNYAYVVGTDGWLQVIDVTNPFYPSLVGSCNYSMPIGNEAYWLWVLDDHVYVADIELGLQIISITDPTNPTFVGNYSFTTYIYNIWIEGDYAFIGADLDGLQVLDISNRTNPLLVDSIPTLEIAISVHVVGDHAYVACYDYLQVIEVMQNRVRQFEHMVVAASTSVIDIPGEWDEIQATLTTTAEVPSGTSITYYLSADNGTHWESVTPGVPHIFLNIGTSVRWKAELSTTESFETPRIRELSISLTSVLQAPSLLSPGDSAFINDTTPTLEWSSMTGVVDYFLQIDTTSAFNSGDLVNVTVYGSTSHTLVTPLTEGTWYWRVFGYDADGDPGLFSGDWSFTIDITPPGTPTLLVPVNDTIQTNNTRPFYWTHVTGSHHYVIQFDTTPMFNSGNLLTEVLGGSAYYPSTPFADGTWYWRVCAVDAAGNYGSYTPYWQVSFDTTAPVWDTPVTDQIAEFAQSFRYDCSASDASGILAYNVNDTARFDVFGNGTIYNNIFLPVGEYWLEVTVVDWVDHVTEATFKITVADTLGPTWEEHAHDIEVEFGHHVDIGWLVFDPSGVDHYAVSDTTHFAIDSTGMVYNITVLEPGTYELTLYAYDIYGNEGSTSITITVLEAVTETATTTQLPDYNLMLIALGGGAVVIVIVVIVVLKSRKGS
ncbi:MAG: hypothetical protein RTV72_13680 [Candidatus Thorarchaeota archaeon]